MDICQEAAEITALGPYIERASPPSPSGQMLVDNGGGHCALEHQRWQGQQRNQHTEAATAPRYTQVVLCSDL